MDTEQVAIRGIQPMFIPTGMSLGMKTAWKIVNIKNNSGAIGESNLPWDRIIQLADAHKCVADYHKKYPQIKEFYNKVQAKIDHGGMTDADGNIALWPVK